MKTIGRGIIPCVFFLLVISGNAAADGSSIWSGLINDVWDGDWTKLNTVATHPDFSKIHKTYNFGGSCDIVGFRSVSRIDGVDYIYGAPEDLVIVDVYTEEYLSGSKGRWNDNVDWIKEDVRISVEGGNISAHVNLSMLWHHSTLRHTATGRAYISKTYYYDYITNLIKDSESIPEQYIYTDQNIDEIEVLLAYYNNTISPKTIIFIPDKQGLCSINYAYKNESVQEDLMIGHVERTDKGIEFVNFTEDPGWGDSRGNMSHIGVCAVVKGANFTQNNLSIIAQTPYTALNVSNYNLSVSNVSANNFIHPLVLPILFILCAPFILIYFIYKRAGG